MQHGELIVQAKRLRDHTKGLEAEGSSRAGKDNISSDADGGGLCRKASSPQSEPLGYAAN